MPLLPTELYQDIISHVTSRTDLYNLLFVCNAVNQETKRFLYRNIAISLLQLSDTLSHTLRADPRLASFIIRLEIISPRLNAIKSRRRRACAEALYDILPRLSRLTQFIIDGDLSVLRPKTKRLFLLKNVNVHLQTLNFHRIDSGDLRQLERFTQLRELVMDMGDSGWNLGAFPNLRVVGCQGSLAHDYLAGPGSRILCFQLTRGVPRDPQPGASPYTFIRSLNVCLYDISIRMFVRITGKFPSLEYVKCTLRVHERNFLVSYSHSHLVHDSRFIQGNDRRRGLSRNFIASPSVLTQDIYTVHGSALHYLDCAAPAFRGYRITPSNPTTIWK